MNDPYHHGFSVGDLVRLDFSKDESWSVFNGMLGLLFRIDVHSDPSGKQFGRTRFFIKWFWAEENRSNHSEVPFFFFDEIKKEM